MNSPTIIFVNESSKFEDYPLYLKELILIMKTNKQEIINQYLEFLPESLKKLQICLETWRNWTLDLVNLPASLEVLYLDMMGSRKHQFSINLGSNNLKELNVNCKRLLKVESYNVISKVEIYYTDKNLEQLLKILNFLPLEIKYDFSAKMNYMESLKYMDELHHKKYQGYDLISSNNNNNGKWTIHLIKK